MSSHPTSGRIDATPRVFWGICMLAAVTLFSYGISGAAGQALFVNEYGSGALPAVWLLVALASMASVALMNRLSARFDVVQLFVGSSYVSAALLAGLLALHKAQVPYVSYAIFVWKDVYIVVLVELLWTFANVAFGARTASKTYGLYGAAGTLGNIAGSLSMGPLVQWMGTFNTLWLVLPALGASAYGSKRLGRGLILPEPAAKAGKEVPRWHEGFAVLSKSRYLGLLLIVVAIVQVVITMTDYQFNAVVETTYLDHDARTEAFAGVNAVVNLASFLLQIGTGFILHHVGVRGVLLGVPLLVGLSLAAFVAMPGYVTMVVAKVLGKTLDYSIFRSAKEILYIPLNYEEKTKGKALVDMLTYRVAKAGASVVIKSITGIGLLAYLGMVNTALCGLWAVLMVFIVRRYRTMKTYESVT